MTVDGSNMLSNRITGFAPGDLIILDDIAFDPSGSAQFSGGQLSMVSGGVTYRLSLENTAPFDPSQLGFAEGAGGEFVVGVNVAPTAVALNNATMSIRERTDTSAPIEIADIVVTDDLFGSNTLSLAGADAASFRIVGTKLFLAPGVVLDHGAKSSYDVVVQVDDPSLGGNPDAISATFRLTVASTAGVTIDGDNSDNIVHRSSTVPAQPLPTDRRDMIRGHGEQDILFGLGDDDTILGGDGNDILRGGSGADSLEGGNGLDWVQYAGSAAAVTISLVADGFGKQSASGGDAQGDILSGFERVAGSEHGDFLTGDGNANALFGLAGDDTLVGGDGRDVLRGGTGADHFVYKNLSGSRVDGARDRILDFEKGIDTIVVEDLSTGVFQFLGTAAFSATGGAELRISETTGGATIVQMDENVDGTPDSEIWVEGVLGLTASDFAL